MTRRGFTLVELTLALVLGGAVLLACLGLLTAIVSSDRALETRYNAFHELGILEQAYNRAMVGLVLVSSTSGDGEQLSVRDPRESAIAGLSQEEEQPEEDELPSGTSLSPAEYAALFPSNPLPRFMLHADRTESLQQMIAAAQAEGVVLPDPGATHQGPGLGWPQRLEIVVSQPPLPASQIYRAPAWLGRPQAQFELLESVYLESGFSVPPDGGVRGCFELRPDGARERVILGMGVTTSDIARRGIRSLAADNERAAALARRDDASIGDAGRPPEGWTLWWRPIGPEEYQARNAGIAFDVDQRPDLLTQAIPIARNLITARFTVQAFQGIGLERARARRNTWLAQTDEDVPGFAELEAETVTGDYRNLMFELGWTLIDVDDEDAEPALDEEPDEENLDQNGVTNNPGAGGSGGNGGTGNVGSGRRGFRVPNQDDDQ